MQRRVVHFEPAAPPAEVRIYVCGITPYDSTHLGHASTYLAYDLLIRRLEDSGRSVRLVRNITDVDDSILPKARELGVDFLELAAAEIARFHSDMEALNTRAPTAEPRATEWVAEMIALINDLEARGHTYAVDGITYFDVGTWPSFGELCGHDQATMSALASARGGTPDNPRQRNPLDFVLWQPSLPDEPEWDSPHGPGRPGWHVECSAMSMGLLGTEIDLHGGGSDLIFPHHECELAQSVAATGQPFARHWMHCGMVSYDGEKMSKSRGNLVFVSDLAKEVTPAAIRLALMGHHYRDDWEWRDGDIAEGQSLLDTLNQAVRIGAADSLARNRVNSGGVRGGDSQDGGEAAGGGVRGGGSQAVRGATSGGVRGGDSQDGGDASSDASVFGRRLRDALDNDLDAPRARAVLAEMADGLIEGRVAPSAAAALVDLCALCGIELDTSHANAWP